jgi:hypothetical protein
LGWARGARPKESEVQFLQIIPDERNSSLILLVEIVPKETKLCRLVIELADSCIDNRFRD